MGFGTNIKGYCGNIEFLDSLVDFGKLVVSVGKTLHLASGLGTGKETA